MGVSFLQSLRWGIVSMVVFWSIPSELVSAQAKAERLRFIRGSYPQLTLFPLTTAKVCTSSRKEEVKLNFLPSTPKCLTRRNPGQLAIDRQFNQSCSDDLRTLTSLLLRDLPSYSNRVIQRTQRANREAGIKNYIVIAGKSEFKPLNLPQIQYNPINAQAPEQIFFTVLERQYINEQIIDIQTYHWLFLTRSSSGWRMVMMFSRFGDSTANEPPTPPRETSDGIIGQGVQLWLRDCRAGTIKN